jgi:hypothetical protein
VCQHSPDPSIPGCFPGLNLAEQAGSVLVFPKFVAGLLDTVGPPRSSFEISVVCPRGRVCTEFSDVVRLKAVWVCPGEQGSEDKRICHGTDFPLTTTVKGTLWFNPENSPLALSPGAAPAPGAGIVSPLVPTPPCQRGFLVVWAVNQFGQPISFNGLIGNAVIRDSVDSAWAYNAVPIQAVAAVAPGQPLAADPLAPLAFNGSQYAVLPDRIFGTVRYERRGNQNIGAIQTDLTFVTLDVRVNAPNLVTFVPLVFYNENERPISTFHEFICWSEVRLQRLDPNLDQNFGGQFALKGLVEASEGATQQNTEFPHQKFPATLFGLVETRELAPAQGPVLSAYGYSLFHDAAGVTTSFCIDPNTTCPR